MKKLLSITLFFASLSIGLAGNVSAAGNPCNQIYGGGVDVCGQAANVQVTKTVLRPGKGGQFVPNLTASDPKYSLGDTISFQINVQNKGNSPIPHLTILDEFPQEASFLSGDGSYDASNRTLTIGLDNLASGASKTYTITAQAVNSTSNPGVVCPKNTVEVASQNAVLDTATSQFCIEKPIGTTLPTPQVFGTPPMKQTPPTGPEMLPLIGLLPAGGLGFLLRRRGK